jgi:hypothetical protein
MWMLILNHFAATSFVYLMQSSIFVFFLCYNDSLLGCFDVQIFLNPLNLPGSHITSSHFDTTVRALARRYL